MQRICIVTHIFPARSETFVKEHVVGLARRGYHITVIAREVGDDISAEELEDIDRLGVTRIYMPAFKATSTKVLKIMNWLRVMRLILRKPSLSSVFAHPAPWTVGALLIACRTAEYVSLNSYDAVHLHFGTLGARLQAVASHYSNIPPLVVTWHGYDANAMPAQLGQGVYQPLFDSDVRHTVGSTFMKNRLMELGACSSRISLIPMGIDLTRFAYRLRELNENEPLKIVAVGRLDEVKGHTYLLEAIKKLSDRGRSVRLRIVGDGPLKLALERQIADTNLAGIVVLLGALPSDQVLAELYDAQLFAVTGVKTASGKAEGQGLVFAEAHATGLPVVACDVGGTADNLIDGRSGWLCRSKDVDAIADAIEYFIVNRNQINTFGAQGRQLVEQNFSVAAMLDRFNKLYARRPPSV